MKNGFIGGTRGMFLSVAAAMATVLSGAALAEATLVPVDSARIFVPVGFDDNDNTQVVLDGYLPSGCYRLARPELTIDPQTRKIVVQAMARYFDITCIEARIPFNITVDVGILPAGDFTVATNKDALRESLNIGEATNAGPDDDDYAPVDAVRVREVAGTDRMVAIIDGRFTNSCMSFDDVKVIDNGASLALLPIIKMEDGATCADVMLPYRKVVNLPSNMSQGRHLLHVRSLNGHALNHMFTVGIPSL